MADDPTGEVTELLQQLIRNGCVNDGTAGSGQEVRNADLLTNYLEGQGLELERFEPVPGRTSVLARLEGRDRDAPTLLLMGHTDVVPASPDGWERDPFAAELVDGEVWGRGAVDMLNLTASMAVALRRLADQRFRPRGTLAYLAVADEEALGHHGAGWLTDHARDAVAADYVITESGGIPMPSGQGGLRLPVIVGEKGTYWCRLLVRGTPGHASQPLRTDNALVKAAEVVRRVAGYRAPAVLHDVWRRFIAEMGFPEEWSAPLLDPDAIDRFCEELPLVGLARQAHACTHLTIAPTIMQAGVKTNVIPDHAEIQLDIRTLPGQTGTEVRAVLEELLGDLSEDVEIVADSDDASTASPVETPLWDVLEKLCRSVYPDSALVPFMTVGATDARFFRRLGVPAYGFGLFSRRMSFDQYNAMFHGDNERVDVESLRLSTDLWEALARDLLV
ncbi:MAG TPA: M20/M25/M40 family metallo-hydrolase [Acidimicrobiales bacterium]|nr:M20/M25/M40 family metallo-hydrolase [Acidimicrobiales bacterium]